MESVLIIVVLVATASAGVRALHAEGRRLCCPVMTLFQAAFTTAVSIAGNVDHRVLDALDRNGELLRSGQWWRLVSPLLVQDGGWAGTIFNLVSLLFIGTLAETVFGSRILIGVYLSAGIISEIAAYTLLPHQGFAGNSVAICGLAALCLVGFARPPRSLAQTLSVLGLLAGILLIVVGNLHGVGFAVGAIAGVALSVLPRDRRGHRRHGTA